MCPLKLRAPARRVRVTFQRSAAAVVELLEDFSTFVTKHYCRQYFRVLLNTKAHYSTQQLQSRAHTLKHQNARVSFFVVINARGRPCLLHLAVTTTILTIIIIIITINVIIVVIIIITFRGRVAAA